MTSDKPKENSIYTYINGIMEPIDKPQTGYGKTIIHWQNGKPVRQEISYTKEFTDTKE